MDRVKLFLLGPPRIERDGVPVKVDTRKAIALVAYLAVTRQSHTRDALAALLWPDYDQTRARAALRRTLSTLRKALTGVEMDVDRENIGIQPDVGLGLDVDQFRGNLSGCQAADPPEVDACHLCLESLAEAVGLYRDDFMAGFTLRDSVNFDEWQFFETEALRRELAGALERLVRCHSALGEFAPAVDYARRWLALDPLDEPAHRYLMQSYAWAGQRSSALHQYEECVRILEEELGVPPLAETTQLYEAIRSGSLPDRPTLAPPGEPAAPPTGREYDRSGDYPLVGRSEEMGHLLEAYSAISVDGQFIVLEGEAGVGKTRLAEGFLAYARSVGALTAEARSYEGETNLAYGPFVEVLRAVVTKLSHTRRLEQVPLHGLGEAARLLPELATLHQDLPPVPSLDSPGAQSRFFEGIRQVLLALSSRAAPGILFLDDLHWADVASLDLLNYLVRRLKGCPVGIFVTWRGKMVPADHPIHHLLSDAQRDGTATVLTLPRLSRAAVLEVVRSVPTADFGQDEWLGERLYQESDGLPVLMVEYLSALATGVQLTRGNPWPLPSSVHDLFRARLAGVSETGRQLLTTAAIIGRSFDYHTLRGASGRSDEETVAALEGLMAEGLIQEVREDAGERGPVYDFVHEKLRTVVYDETSLARQRLLHLRVAETLADMARGHRDPDRQIAGASASQIAGHYRLGGRASTAAEYYELAGDRARSLYANADAMAHYRAALALGHPDMAALHEAIGDLQTLSGEYNEALASYGTATALGEPGALARLEHKMGNVHQRRGEWDRAERYYESALDAYGEEGLTVERASLYADWSLTAHRQGDAERASDLARHASDLGETTGDKQALAQAHNMQGILAFNQRDMDAARHHLENSLALAEALGNLGAQAAALNNLALTWGAVGETARAVALAETALRLCSSQGDRHREAALHNSLADLLHAAGRVEASMIHLKQAAAIFAEIGGQDGSWQPEIWKLVEW